MYNKDKAENLVKEFKYLIGKPYFPFGKDGREFKITDVKSDLPKLIINWTKKQVNSDNPYFEQEQEKEHTEGLNWNVILFAENNADNLKVELEEGLSKMDIKHDIDKLFNQ